MGKVGIKLLNAVKNELLPIVFKINNKYRYDIVASVHVSIFEVRVIVWEASKKGNGEHVIYLNLVEINNEIVVDEKFAIRCPASIETYADLVSALKKYLTA